MAFQTSIVNMDESTQKLLMSNHRCRFTVMRENLKKQTWTKQTCKNLWVRVGMIYDLSGTMSNSSLLTKKISKVNMDKTNMLK